MKREINARTKLGINSFLVITPSPVSFMYARIILPYSIAISSRSSKKNLPSEISVFGSGIVEAFAVLKCYPACFH